MLLPCALELDPSLPEHFAPGRVAAFAATGQGALSLERSFGKQVQTTQFVDACVVHVSGTLTIRIALVDVLPCRWTAPKSPQRGSRILNAASALSLLARLTREHAHDSNAEAGFPRLRRLNHRARANVGTTGCRRREFVRVRVACPDLTFIVAVAVAVALFSRLALLLRLGVATLSRFASLSGLGVASLSCLALALKPLSCLTLEFEFTLDPLSRIALTRPNPER